MLHCLRLEHDVDGQLGHAGHGEEHDGQEGDAKEGAGAQGSVLTVAKQRTDDQGHDDHLRAARKSPLSHSHEQGMRRK